MYDPHTRESRGFGFVTMESAEEADAAIAALNGTDLMGKVMSVDKACTSFQTFTISPHLSW
jgi:transformer-2 protein